MEFKCTGTEMKKRIDFLEAQLKQLTSDVDKLGEYINSTSKSVDEKCVTCARLINYFCQEYEFHYNGRFINLTRPRRQLIEEDNYLASWDAIDKTIILRDKKKKIVEAVEELRSLKLNELSQELDRIKRKLKDISDILSNIRGVNIESLLPFVRDPSLDTVYIKSITIGQKKFDFDPKRCDEYETFKAWSNEISTIRKRKAKELKATKSIDGMHFQFYAFLEP